MELETLKQIARRYRADIPQPFDEMLDIGGFESIRRFTDYYGGSSSYIPTFAAVFQPCLDKEAIAFFNGGNYKELVRRFGKSESYWRRLLS